MTPLGMLLAGFAFVVLDFRAPTHDLIPDPIGWVVIGIAMLRLAMTHTGFQLAAASSVVGFLASIAALPGSLEAEALWSTVDGVATTGVVFGVCTGIRALAAAPRDRSAAETIRWTDLLLTAVTVGAFLLTGGERIEAHGLEGLPVLVFILAVLGLLMWFLLLVWRVRREPQFLAMPAPAQPR